MNPTQPHPGTDGYRSAPLQPPVQPWPGATAGQPRGLTPSPARARSGADGHRGELDLPSVSPGPNTDAGDRVAPPAQPRDPGAAPAAERPGGGARVMSGAQSLLVVDDDARFRERLVKALERRGYEVTACDSGAQARAAAQLDSPELALVDLRLPGEWGLHIVRELLAIDRATRVVVLTAYGSIATALEAVRIGAVSYLQKPASVAEIERAFASPDLPADGPAHAPAEVPSLAKAEWEHINRVLTECDGNIRKAAGLLGLHRRTLQRKLAKFPVSR